MRLSLLLAALAVALALALAPALAEEPAANKEAEAAAVEAGKAAGSAAGAQAGAATGAEAGKKAAAGGFAEKMTVEQYKELAAKNTGAAQFFTDFDKDGNHHWSKTEFLAAIRAVVSRDMLPANYDSEGNWEKLPKNVEEEVNFRDFLNWASQMKARPPPAAAANASKEAASQVASGQAKDCKSLFSKYDKDGSGTLDETEFRASMQGRYDDSKLAAVYTDLDRQGAKGTLAEAAYTDFCAKLTGMPRDASKQNENAGEANEEDPCKGDPCAEHEGTVCRADPKKCVKEPCPQYACVKAESEDKGGDGKAAAEARSPYSKCIQLFDSWDNNGKDKQLSYAEFERGVAQEQAAGRMPKTFAAQRAWEALEHEDDTLDVYEFVHFCLAQSSGEQDADTVDQECFEVFSHWDSNARDLSLNGREFWRGMRRAQRQGHLPASVRIGRVWKKLPKVNGEVEPGPFVDFCRSMSRGADPEAAAKDTQAPAEVEPQVPDLDAAAAKEVDEALKKAAEGGDQEAAAKLEDKDAKVEYQEKPAEAKNDTEAAGNSTAGVDNVGHAASTHTDIFCTKAFHKADGNADAQLTAGEFKFACQDVVPGKACDNYTAIFDAFDTSGKKYLSHVDFVRLCKAAGNATAAGEVVLDSAYLTKLAKGADAGARAGARAGAEAGRQAGMHAGIDAAERHHLGELAQAGEESSEEGSEETKEEESEADEESSQEAEDTKAENTKEDDDNNTAKDDTSEDKPDEEESTKEESDASTESGSEEAEPDAADEEKKEEKAEEGTEESESSVVAAEEESTTEA